MTPLLDALSIRHYLIATTIAMKSLLYSAIIRFSILIRNKLLCIGIFLTRIRTVGASFVGNRHGNGFGEFWLDRVNCTGIETSIDKCAHSQWGAHGCTSDNAVSIRCGECRTWNCKNFDWESGTTIIYTGRLHWDTITLNKKIFIVFGYREYATEVHVHLCKL